MLTARLTPIARLMWQTNSENVLARTPVLQKPGHAGSMLTAVD
jgi:hypothetical protein